MASLLPSTKVESQTLKALGLQTLELLSEHVQHLHSKPVKPKIEPGQFAKRFDSFPPEKPRAFADLLDKVKADILPGVTHWQHPRFMAYYPSSGSVPAILAETVIAAIGSVGLQWSANPIATELEVVVMDWLAHILGLGGEFLHMSGKGGGILQNTAGEAIVAIMVCARVQKHRKLNPSLSRDEAFYQDSSKFVVYMSDQTHFSGPKACRVSGMRVNSVSARLVNGNYRLCCDDVRAAIEKDKAAGLVPVAIQLNYGSTNTSGCDDISEFEELVKVEDLWLHMDAAYAGPSWALEEFRGEVAAVNRIATSVNVNGSKWFLCGFDSAFLWIRDRRLLTEVFAASDVYMPASGDSIYAPEFKDWALPLGRRFRALRIWLVIEYFGVEGIKLFLRRAIAQADWLKAKVDAHPSIEQLVQTRFGLVCLALTGAAGEGAEGVANIASLSEHLQEAGFLSYPSSVHGKAILRVALGGSATSQEDVETLWEEIQSFLKKICHAD